MLADDPLYNHYRSEVLKFLYERQKKPGEADIRVRVEHNRARIRGGLAEERDTDCGGVPGGVLARHRRSPCSTGRPDGSVADHGVRAAV